MNTPNLSIDNSGKALRVRAMFAEIAPRYDFLNHALSLNVDRRWRKLLVSKVAHRLRSPGAVALDLCCGTGDLSIELGELAETVGLDFCHPMLKIAAGKVQQAEHAITLVEGDALHVPMTDSSFDVVSIAFGLRNLESVDAGLHEIFRLLKPGGLTAVLEFSHPRLPVFRDLFSFYFSRILPRVGNAVSGSKFAYRYLPESVEAFPDQDDLACLLEAAGFSRVAYFNLFGGVAALHLGEKQ